MSAPSSPSAPSQIGPYAVTRELGRGGMGVVYLAHDPKLDRDVAIKALPAHLAQDPDRLARFQREAKVLASLNHPGIAAIHGLEDVGGALYLVLEYVDGETLADRLNRGPIPVDEALSLARHIAEALEAAHEKGIVHRDLKPGNVMVSTEGKIKVLDFGLARSGDGAPSSTNYGASANSPHSPTVTAPPPIHSPTIAGAIMGTAGYMSPEQARGKGVDKRSDIFSFGCVLFEMLSGKQPFSGETVADSLGATLHKELDFALLPPTTPATVQLLIRRCVAKDRAKRLHDIADARIEIEQTLADPSASGLAFGVAHTQRSRTRGAAALLGALLLGLALAGLPWLAFGQRRAAGVPAGVQRLAVDMPRGFTPRRVAIAGDGRHMAFSGLLQQRGATADVRDSAKSYAAFVRAVDSYTFKPLPVTSLVDPCVFAPDGNSVALVVQAAADTARKRIIRVAVTGDAPPLTIADLPTGLTYDAIAWPTADEILLSQASPPMLLRVGVTNGQVGKPLAITIAGKSPYLNEVIGLPNGAGLLGETSYYSDLGYVQSISCIDTTTGLATTLVADGQNPRYLPSGHLLFSRGESLLAVGCDTAGGVKLVGAPEVIAGGLRTRLAWAYAVFDVSNTGTLIHLPGGVQGNKRRVMVFDEAGKTTPLAPDERAFQSLPIVSPDGSRVAVSVANGSGINETWVSRPDRSGFDRAVALPNVDCDPLVFTSDSAGVVVSRIGVSEPENGLYLRDLTGAKPLALVALTRQSETTPLMLSACLPDRSALLVPILSGIRVDVKRIPLQPSAAHQPDLVLPDLQGNVSVAVSPDGKWLAWCRMGGERSGVFLAPMPAPGSGGVPGDGAQLSPSPSFRVRFKATPPGEPLVLSYLDNKGRAFTGSLVTTPFPSLNNVKLTGDANDRTVVDAGRAILDDGRVVAVVAGVDEEPPTSASLVLNWFEDLKKRMPAK